MSASIRASVIIPNYRGLRFLPDCMQALSLQTISAFDIVVIDNGSGDEDLLWLENWVKQDSDRHILIKNADNLGFSSAVNLGLRRALTLGLDYAILLNNDTKAAPDFIEKLIYTMDQDTDNALFALSSKMVKMHDPGIMDDAGDQYTLMGWQFMRGLEESSSLPEWNRSADVISACAGAAIYRTSVFQEIGLFDEKHFAYLEDIDVSLRAALFGYRIRYCPEAVCAHVGSGTSGSKYNNFKVRLSARNSVYILYKNFPILLLLLNAIPLLFGFAVKYLFFLKKGFGKSYAEGLKEGLKTLHGLNRVPFSRCLLRSVLRLEFLIVCATWEYGCRLVKKYILKHHN